MSEINFFVIGKINGIIKENNIFIDHFESSCPYILHSDFIIG